MLIVHEMKQLVIEVLIHLKRLTEETEQREVKVSEEDVLRVARRMLPITNLAISKMSQLFSGEPAMTLKVE